MIAVPFWVGAELMIGQVLPTYAAELTRSEPIANLLQIAQAEPNSAEGYFYQGNDYLDQGNYEGAIAAFTRSIQLAPGVAAA